MDYLVKNNILTSKQHGFMKGKSCTTNRHLDAIKSASCICINDADTIISYLHGYSKEFDKIEENVDTATPTILKLKQLREIIPRAVIKARLFFHH